MRIPSPFFITLMTRTWPTGVFLKGEIVIHFRTFFALYLMVSTFHRTLLYDILLHFISPLKSHDLISKPLLQPIVLFCLPWPIQV